MLAAAVDDAWMVPFLVLKYSRFYNQNPPVDLDFN